MIAIVRWWVQLLRAMGITVPSGKSAREKSWREFFWRVVLAIPVVALIILLTWCSDRLGWLRGFETAHLDTMLRLRPQKMSQNIVIVEIGEADYHHVFEGASPLDKLKLIKLVKAVKQYGPSVIGVDIDTNDWSSECHRRQVDANCDTRCAKKCADLREQLTSLEVESEPARGSTRQKPAVIWAAVPQTLQSPLKLNPVVGGMGLGKPGEEGIPRFPIDPDGSVRHYENRIEVARQGGSCPPAAPKQQDGKCYELTLAGAVLAAYPYPGKQNSANEGQDEQVIFNFYGDRYRFPTIDSNNFFTTEVDDSHRTPEEAAAETTRNNEIKQRRTQLLEGKIVLIGGGYAEARDAYTTPLGVMEGVVLNALAIETDLTRSGIRDLNRFEELLADVAISIFIVWAFYWYDRRPKKALFLSFLVIPVAFVSSWLAFNTLAYWFNFIPAAVGMVCHQLYELAEGWAEAQEKLEEISRERARPAVPPIDTAPAAVEQKARSAVSGAQ